LNRPDRAQPYSRNYSRTHSEDSLFYLGWRVVLVCQLGVLTGVATLFFTIFTLMMKPWQQEFGWSREQISQAFSLAAITVAICSPFMGRLFDRFEPRKLIAAMMVAFGLGIASLAWLSPHPARLYLTTVFIGIAGTGTYQLGYARIVASWFQRRLGTALSVVVAGSGIGSIFFPPLVQHSITVSGWRNTWLFLAALPLFVGAPLTFFFAPSLPAKSVRKPAAMLPDSGAGLHWRRALRTLSFWLIALGVCCMSLAENGVLVHLAPMLSDRGLKIEDAALIVSVLGGSSVAGRLLLGWILDFFRGSYIAACSLFLAGTGLFLLGRGQSFHATVIAAAIAGLGMGCEFDLMPYLLKRYFGMHSFSTLYGLVYTVYAAAGAAAPLIFGHIYDLTGSYVRITSIFSGFTAAAALCMFALPAYRFVGEASISSKVLPPVAAEAVIESN
jgi:MFS family permease